MASEPSIERVILSYTAEPDSRQRRRQRRWAALALCSFCLFYGFAFAFFVPVFILVFVLPIFLMAMLCIWALPETAPPARILGFLFLAFLVTKLMWPDYLALSLPGLPWITLVRVTAAPMTLTLLIALSVSREFRDQLGVVLRSTPSITRLVVVFVVIQVVSLPLSHHLFDSLNRFVNDQFEWTAMFFASCWYFAKPGRAERWIVIFWAVAIPVCLIAMIEFKMGHVPWAGHIPGFLKIEDESVQRTLAGFSRAYTGRYRSESTFTTPLGLAEYLALAIPFVLHFALNRYPWQMRSLAAATIPLILVGSWLTNARLGSIGLLAAATIYALFWALNRQRWDRNNTAASIIVKSYPILFMALISVTLTVGRIRRLVWGGAETQSSTDGRKAQFEAGLPLIAKNPIGHGVGQAATVLGFRAPDGLLTIDSYFLSTLLEYGVVGFIVYYGLFSWTAYTAARAGLAIPPCKRELSLLIPASVSIMVYILIKSVFAEDGNNTFGFILTGMISALLFRRKTEAGVTAAPRSSQVARDPRSWRQNSIGSPSS
jgi:hypothetical protein